jgi:hypothetical protein
LAFPFFLSSLFFPFTLFTINDISFIICFYPGHAEAAIPAPIIDRSTMVLLALFFREEEDLFNFCLQGLNIEGVEGLKGTHFAILLFACVRATK